jgi:alpha-1,3-rhamnosyltransferase
MKPLPLVSVIVASYNHAAYIEDCIGSILRQTYPKIELIVIDDGSTDESLEILQRLAARHDFYLASQENIGLANTLNKALTLCRGKYISVLGSDDLMMLDKIEKQVHFLERRPDLTACGGNIICIDAQGRVLRKQKFYAFKEFGFEELFLGVKPGIPAPTMMVRAEVLKKEGGWDERVRLEDLHLWLKLTHRGYRLAFLNDVLAYYRKHASNSYKNLDYMLTNVLKTYEPYRKEPGYQKVVNKFLTSTFITAAKRDKKLAFKLLFKVNPRFFPLKYLRGCFYLLRP